jgi:hypothetical protein
MGHAPPKGGGVVKRLLVLFLFLGLWVSPAMAGPKVPQKSFNIGRLHYGGGGDWYANPSALPNLLTELRLRLGMDTPPDPVTVTPMEDELFSLPMVYFTGHGNVRFTPAERDRLRAYVAQGGFIWADDNYGMDVALRKEVKELFPGEEMKDVPFAHPIFKLLYPFPSGVPKIHEHDGKPPQALGIFQKDRLVFLYTYESDIGDGMEDQAVHNDPLEKHEAALRFAMNVVVYVLSF